MQETMQTMNELLMLRTVYPKQDSSVMVLNQDAVSGNTSWI
jgi:hypothetical protein